MALSKQIMATGFSAQQAQAMGGGSSVGLTATGTVIGDALALTQAINIIGTVAAGTGVQLPPCAPSDEVFVYNGGANALLVYPQLTGVINSGAPSAGFSVAATKSAIFKHASSAAIIAVLSA